jgi:GAF domain-containing protein
VRLDGIGRDVSERVAREREREETIGFLQTRYEAATDRSLDFEPKVSRFFELGQETLGLRYGYQTRIEVDDGPDGGTQTVVQATGDHELLRRGEQSRLSQSYCRRTIETREVVAIDDSAAAGWEGDPAFETFDLASYLGTTVTVDDDVHGALFFASRTPRGSPSRTRRRRSSG